MVPPPTAPPDNNVTAIHQKLVHFAFFCRVGQFEFFSFSVVQGVTDLVT